jgi:hypothetical protein
MYKFDEKALRRGISMGLGSQGIWTPELENVMFDEITNKALRIHDVVGRSEQFTCSCGIPPAIRLCEGVETCLTCGESLSK